ncbi:hypothetical protein QN400_06025 [Pseudomonas sp. RTC3]|uniref:hypothetical protein n=1 Tax=Pseudomonas sp. 5C2 TaxID=3048588 RepID=UPI002AB5D524|nr:hypothetical protein [Pseudomonas sp. 5C2]MDY7566649.1 hypothetical protein [Pseudomonas sp. 5C2]MEB0061576.1 hypothetical protein [Pseudomonas sp. RTC3]MEB0240622.1 hypothetical protein [Pseudomonas sp. 5C2]
MSEYVIREAKTPDLTKFTVLLNDIQIDGNIHNLLSKLSDLNERVFGEDNTNIQFKDIADRIDSGKIDRMHTVDTRSYFNPEIKE